MRHPQTLVPEESILLVVDVQEKLLAKIPNADLLVSEVDFAIEVAKAVGVEILGTEQYPKGLGPTVASLAAKLPPCPAKTDFSCCGVPNLIDDFRARGKTRVVLVGMETHVCVLNTALDLCHAGFHVYLVVDAVASRFRQDHEIAIDRMRSLGVVLTTVETVAFEWLGGAKHPAFKKVSGLVQERMKRMESKVETSVLKQ